MPKKNKTIIMIHGRSFKPSKTNIGKLWIDALEHGINRDCSQSVINKFSKAEKKFIYYGDISNEYLSCNKQHYDHDKCTCSSNRGIVDDTNSRRHTLIELKKWRKNQFNKKNYNNTPGKESLKEGATDVLAPLLSFFHLSDNLIQKVAPDMGEYWKGESCFGSCVREPIKKPLMAAFDQNDSICLIAHSLGSMIAFDTLYKFSYWSEYRKYNHKKVDLFLTLGSPLSDETVQRKLFGSALSSKRKYPRNIENWVNVAAEDDFISHDSKLKNDYKMMKKYKLVKDIVDYEIYNLSLRDGKSNPHHSGGYLIHPKVAKVVGEWLG